MLRIFSPLASSGLDDGPLAVGHVAESVFGPRERDQAFGRKFRSQSVADRPVHHAPRVVVIAKQKRNVDDVDFGDEVSDRTGRCVDDIKRAQLHRLDHLALAAQRRSRKLLALVASAGAYFHFFAKSIRADAVVRRGRGGVAELDRRLRCRGCESAADEHCHERMQRSTSHVFSCRVLNTEAPQY